MNGLNSPALRHRGADVLVRALKREGVTRIFTVSGNHIMPVFDAVLDAGISLIHTRHEAAALHMADAHARITGETGVALVTGGPGHANAVGALFTALMAESPVLLLSGHAPHNQLGMGAFQEMRQVEMAAPVCKASVLSSSSGALAGELARCIRIARSGRPGPVHLSLPTDVLEADAGGQNTVEADLFALPDEPGAVPADVLQEMMRLLASAKRPLILCGPSMMNQRGRSDMARLEQACCVPVIGMESPRGIQDPSLGAFAQMLEQSDCLLLLGKRLDFTLKFGAVPAVNAQARFMQIDPDAAELERSARALGSRLLHSVRADTQTALRAMETGGFKVARSGWVQEVHDALAWRPPAWAEAQAGSTGLLHPVQALRPFQAVLDSHPESVLISDGGEFGQWAQACLSAPHRVINGVAGAIGSGLPFALAARLAVPEAPVLAVMGDGTFGFHTSEMETAVRHQLPFVVLVGNDARWNAEYQIQVRDYGPARTHGCELLPARYDEVTSAFGGHGEYVTQAADLLPAAHRAFGAGKAACINVRIEGQPAPAIKRP